ncbi:hypothetical protein VTJ83DRAFT_3446 [Remersonia thermophila]|uniref:Uncharacterized protein n=1 Tax=Remersonia thermophila TaxID=72144 RepID=A0ABR4DE74_9PEZI
MDHLNGTKSDHTPLPVSEKQAVSNLESAPERQQRPSSPASTTCLRKNGVVLLLCGLLLWGGAVAVSDLRCHGDSTELQDGVLPSGPEPIEAVPRIHVGREASIPRLARRQETTVVVITPGAEETGSSTSEADDSSSSDPPAETSSTPDDSSTSGSSEPPESSTSSSSESSTTSEPSESSTPPPETSTTTTTTGDDDSTLPPPTSTSDLPDTTLTTTTRGTTTDSPTTTTRPSTSRSVTTTFTSTQPDGAVITITDVTWVPAEPTDTGSPGGNAPTLQNVAPRSTGSVVATVMAAVVGFAGMLLL